MDTTTLTLDRHTDRASAARRVRASVSGEAGRGSRRGRG
jgi:hypothetical protein